MEEEINETEYTFVVKVPTDHQKRLIKFISKQYGYCVDRFKYSIKRRKLTITWYGDLDVETDNFTKCIASVKGVFRDADKNK